MLIFFQMFVQQKQQSTHLESNRIFVHRKTHKWAPLAASERKIRAECRAPGTAVPLSQVLCDCPSEVAAQKPVRWPPCHWVIRTPSGLGKLSSPPVAWIVCLWGGVVANAEMQTPPSRLLFMSLSTANWKCKSSWVFTLLNTKHKPSHFALDP